MATSITVRSAGSGDTSALALLCAQLGYPVAEPELADRLAELLASPRCCVLVAVGEDDRPCAWISVERRVSLESGACAEISGLVVAASHRRAGLGRLLVAAAERWAMSQRLHLLRVRSNVARSESHPFYLGIGYARRKSQHVYEKALPTAAAAE